MLKVCEKMWIEKENVRHFILLANAEGNDFVYTGSNNLAKLIQNFADHFSQTL